MRFNRSGPIGYCNHPVLDGYGLACAHRVRKGTSRCPAGHLSDRTWRRRWLGVSPELHRSLDRVDQRRVPVVTSLEIEDLAAAPKVRPLTDRVLPPLPGGGGSFLSRLKSVFKPAEAFERNKHETMSAIDELVGQEVSFKMDGNFEFYVETAVEIAGDGNRRLFAPTAASVQGAVDAWWDEVNSLPEGAYLSVGPYGPNPRNVIWNGVGWVDLEVPTELAKAS